MKPIVFIVALLYLSSCVAATCTARGVHAQMQLWPSLEYQYIAGIDAAGSTTYLTTDQMVSPWLQVIPIDGGGTAAGDFYLQDLYSNKRIGFLYSHCDSNPMSLSTSRSSYISTFSINSVGILRAHVQFPIGTNYQTNPSNQWYCSVADNTRLGYTTLVTNTSSFAVLGKNVPTTTLTYQTGQVATRFIDGDGVTYTWDAAAKPLCSDASSNDPLVWVFIVVLFVIISALCM